LVLESKRIQSIDFELNLKIKKMNKAIYIATSEQNSGKSIITLGLMSMLIGKMAKVGYFRPIVEDFEEGGFDNHMKP
jgi:phosphate acetyltransferase